MPYQTTSVAGALSVLTPYLHPSDSNKTSNIGDGLILLAIERQLGSFDRKLMYSSRCTPLKMQQEAMRQSRGIVLAGANQLSDDFTPWPGLRPDELRRQNFVFLPMGVGLHGDPERNASISRATREIIEIIHARTEYSSWRCPRTVAYLAKELPQLAPRFLMTGCPVLYDRPLLESSRFHIGHEVIAVTVTERDDFWSRETNTIDFVAQEYPRARKYLVLHQDYGPKRAKSISGKLFGLWQRTAAALHRYAVFRGFEVVRPHDVDQIISFYEKVDLHFGSRLHAHLHMLSQNKCSYLTKVDERSTGISEHFAFPLCDPLRFGDYIGFDFEAVRQAAQRTFPTMQVFVDSINANK